jgi:hypothetical protein
MVIECDGDFGGGVSGVSRETLGCFYCLRVDQRAQLLEYWHQQAAAGTTEREKVLGGQRRDLLLA